MPAHLKDVHKISAASVEFKRLLQKALLKRKRPRSVQVKAKLTESEALSFERESEVFLKDFLESDMAEGVGSKCEEEGVDFADEDVDRRRS